TGIPSEELPNLFKRFHRVRGVRSRSHEGSGIGLALIRELVRFHGGTVDVESTMGKGSSFKVRVPAGNSHLPSDRLHPSTTPSSPTAPPLARPGRPPLPRGPPPVAARAAAAARAGAGVPRARPRGR